MSEFKKKFSSLGIIFKLWPYLSALLVVLIFFFPVFSGKIPFPGDLLVSQAPYKAYSYLGFAPGGMPNKAQGPDVINEIYPWRYFSFNQLKSGVIPFWNPHNFSGNPQMADFQTAVFYPLNVSYLILPFNISWTLLIFLQPLLAIIFMYLFLTRGLGLSRVPALLGGLTFGFSSYMVVWIEYGNIGNTILWLPLTLLFTKYFVKKASVMNMLGIVGSLFMAVLAGYIQGVFYSYIVIFSYYLYLLFSQNILKEFKKHVIFLLSLIIPLILSLFQILPTLSLFSQSTRGAYSLTQIEKSLAPIYYWITAFAPDFFGNPASRNYWLDGTYIERVLYPGGVMMFFAFISIFNKTKIIEKRFFAFISVISLLIATNLPFVKYFYLIPIPVISTTVPTREFSLFIFSIIILGSIGLNTFLNEKKTNIKPLVFYSLIYIFIITAVFVLFKFNPNLSDNLKVSLRNLILPSLILICLLLSVFVKRFSKKTAIIIISLILIFDLLSFFNKITPFSDTKLVYPETPLTKYLKQYAGMNRVWGYGSAYIPSNFQSVDQTFSPEGNDPLHISRYGELLASSINGKPPHVLPRPDANIAPGFGQDDLRNNEFRKRILDLLAVKYIIFENNNLNSIGSAEESTFPKNDYKLVASLSPWQVYENKNIVQRAFISSKYVLAKDKNDALNLIYDKNIDLRDTLILEEKPKLNLDNNASGKIDLIKYDANNIKYKINITGNSLFFISDNFYPEWEAKVDEKVVKVLLSNYSFRAVEIPKGLHTLEFYYSPKSFILGLKLSIIAVVLLVFSIFYVRKNKKI